MSSPRPGGVTLICVLAVTGGLIDLVVAQRDLGDFETAQWVYAHPQQAQIEQVYHYVHAGVMLLSSYFMMHAHGWARWLYLGWNTARFATGLALMYLPGMQESIGFLRLKAGMIPSGAFFLLSLWLLFRSDAREYFAHGRKPWWRE